MTTTTLQMCTFFKIQVSIVATFSIYNLESITIFVGCILANHRWQLWMDATFLGDNFSPSQSQKVTAFIWHCIFWEPLSVVPATCLSCCRCNFGSPWLQLWTVATFRAHNFRRLQLSQGSTWSTLQLILWQPQLVASFPGYNLGTRWLQLVTEIVLPSSDQVLPSCYHQFHLLPSCDHHVAISDLSWLYY